jgi:hypothetical protein
VRGKADHGDEIRQAESVVNFERGQIVRVYGI